MAVKWAVANGNWNAGATWNDGVVPAGVDEVYLNGYTVTISSYNGIACKLISNDRYGNLAAGGSISMTFTEGQILIVTANLFCVANTTLFTSSSKYRGLSIVGNIENYGYIFSSSYSGSGGFFATGICDNYGTLFSPTTSSGNITLRIIGNVNSSGLIIGGSYSTSILPNVLFEGECTISSTPFRTKLGTFDCNNITLYNNVNISCETLNIDGSIRYTSNNNLFGINYTAINILNPDTFTWKDITEPRVNPFIILTDAEMNNRQQYPPEDEVKEGTEYVWGEKVGTYQQPPESVVLKGYRYDNDEKEGTLENENIVGCVTPEDVRKDVPLVGMGVVGTLVVPSVDDVREGVIFDNGSVGTLIVQGGGDRLRIADFGYYTNAQSDTYIVDLTEQDKPKFAVAEERVLIEMFPDLDLDNIPEKYFDDLFVKYLKYRLIVEYYRTAGINSTFTPSEPTTEIVNYQNVRNEVWLNSANIYLKAWGKKYPESIVKPQRILL